MAATPYKMNVGIFYVVQAQGFDRPLYKLGKTAHSVRGRIAPATTFTPAGIQTLRAQVLFDYDNGETNIHTKLNKWHCEPSTVGGAKEMFSATLARIDDAIAGEVALQQAHAMPFFEGLEILKENAFFQGNAGGLLDDVLDAPILRGVTLKNGIIRAINSTSDEDKVRIALANIGIQIDKRSRTAKVLCKETLARLVKVRAKSKCVLAALENFSHFNSVGNPIFN